MPSCLLDLLQPRLELSLTGLAQSLAHPAKCFVFEPRAWKHSPEGGAEGKSYGGEQQRILIRDCVGHGLQRTLRLLGAGRLLRAGLPRG